LPAGDWRSHEIFRYVEEMRTWLVSLGVLVFGLSVAHAQPAPDAPPDGTPPPPTAPSGPPGATPAPAPAPAAAPAPIATTAPPPSNIDSGVLDDANAGRTWVAPTALSAPAGTWSFSDWELLVVGADYAPTNNLDVSAATVIPVASGQPFVLMLTGKLQLVHSGRLRLAAHAAFAYTGSTDNDSSGGVGTVGGVATVCLDDGCNSNASGYVGLGFATSGESEVPIALAGSVTARLGRHVKFVGEIDSAAVLGHEFDSFGEGFLFWYGLRFTSHNIGVDLGLMLPVFKGTTTNTDINGNTTTSDSWQVGFVDGTFPIGFPVISFDYRT
jgi:hypothetical protein